MWSSLLKSIGIVNEEKEKVDRRLKLVARHLKRLYLKDVYAIKSIIILKFVAFHIHRVGLREKKKEIAALLQMIAEHCRRISLPNEQQPDVPVEETEPLQSEEVFPPSDE